MIDINGYLNEVKIRLATSTVIAKIETVTERTTGDRGYFRARLSLANGDFLEISEYFVIHGHQPKTLEYRYQWMDAAKQKLICRWDNAPHFPELPQFPDHIHLGDEQQVAPGQALSILGLIDLIEQKLANAGQ